MTRLEWFQDICHMKYIKSDNNEFWRLTIHLNVAHVNGIPVANVSFIMKCLKLKYGNVTDTNLTDHKIKELAEKVRSGPVRA